MKELGVNQNVDSRHLRMTSGIKKDRRRRVVLKSAELGKSINNVSDVDDGFKRLAREELSNVMEVVSACLGDTVKCDPTLL